MAEDASGFHQPTNMSSIETAVDHVPQRNLSLDKTQTNGSVDWPASPTTPTPNPFSRAHTSIDLDDYFTGPRDLTKHSKWPLFLRMHGSILPKMIVPLLWVGGWATMITLLTKLVPNVNLGVNSILLTVTGFVVSLGLSFSTSTAYERYGEGRKAWAQVVEQCQVLGRVLWVHTIERPECQKKDVLSKLTAMNLLVAFAVSLKHKLRFEPYSNYEDIEELIAHLSTYAQNATTDGLYEKKTSNLFKRVGEHLGLSFAQSNPRKLLKKSGAPIGNLPLEILCYLSGYVDEIVNNGQLTIPLTQSMAYTGITSLNNAFMTAERVLSTPLPIGYSIAISQITWVYVMLLPFQLLSTLDWITIPATVAAAYIILGFLIIGHEIEDPFGNDVNDLPLDIYCQQIVHDLEIIASRPRLANKDWIETEKNKPMFPNSSASFTSWTKRSERAIRDGLRHRPYATYDATVHHGRIGTTSTKEGTPVPKAVTV